MFTFSGQAFGAAELGRTGTDLLGEFGLGHSLALPLLGKLHPDGEDFGLLLVDMADGWVGELPIKVAIPFGLHLAHAQNLSYLINYGGSKLKTPTEAS